MMLSTQATATPTTHVKLHGSTYVYDLATCVPGARGSLRDMIVGARHFVRPLESYLGMYREYLSTALTRI